MLNAYVYFLYIHCTVISILCDHNTKPQSTVLVNLLLMWVIMTLSKEVSDAIMYPAISTEPYQLIASFIRESLTRNLYSEAMFMFFFKKWTWLHYHEDDCCVNEVMISVTYGLKLTQNVPECSLRWIKIQNFPGGHTLITHSTSCLW